MVVFFFFFKFFLGGVKISPNFDLKNYDLDPHKGFSMEKTWFKFARS
jgi:hypothetical protein